MLLLFECPMWRTHRGTLDETCVEVEVDSRDVDGTVRDVDGTVQDVDGTVQHVDGSDAGFSLQTRQVADSTLNLRAAPCSKGAHGAMRTDCTLERTPFDTLTSTRPE